MEEAVALKTMKERFASANENDLRRFVKSADGKLEGDKGAIAAFERHTAWRAALGPMNKLYDSTWVEIEKRKLYLRGKDKAGKSILWWETQNNDPKVRDLDVMVNGATYWVLSLEPMLDAAKARGEDGELSVVVDRELCCARSFRSPNARPCLRAAPLLHRCHAHPQLPNDSGAPPPQAPTIRSTCRLSRRSSA